MAKVTPVNNGELGSSIRAKWNNALQSVEVDGITMTGDGNDTPLAAVSQNIAWDTCKTTSDSNETLSGLRNIGSYDLLENDRILLTSQTNATENGIYVASTGTWSRATDADESREFIQGKHVRISDGGYVGWVFHQTSDSYPTITSSVIEYEGTAPTSASNLEVGDSNLNLTNDAGYLVADDILGKQDTLTAHEGVLLSNNVLSMHRRLTGTGVAGVRPGVDTGLGNSTLGEISYLGDDLILSGFGLTESGHQIDGSYSLLTGVNGLVYPNATSSNALIFEGADGGNYPLVDGKDYMVFYKEDGDLWDLVTVTDNGSGQPGDWYFYEIDTDPTSLTSTSTGVEIHPVPRYSLDMTLLFASGDEYYDGVYLRSTTPFAITYSSGQYRIDTTVTDRAAFYAVFAGTLALVAWSTDLNQWFLWHTPLTSTSDFVDTQGIGQFNASTQVVGRRKGFGADTELVDGIYFSSYGYLDYAGTLEYYANLTVGGSAANEEVAGTGVTNNSFLGLEDQALYVITDTVANNNQLALTTSAEVKSYVSGVVLDSIENTWVDVNKVSSSLKGSPTSTLSTTPQSALNVTIPDGTYGTARVLIHALRDDDASVISMEYLVSVHCTSSTVNANATQSAISSFGGTQSDLVIAFATSSNALDVNVSTNGAEEYVVSVTWNMITS